MNIVFTLKTMSRGQHLSGNLKNKIIVAYNVGRSQKVLNEQFLVSKHVVSTCLSKKESKSKISFFSWVSELLNKEEAILWFEVVFPLTVWTDSHNRRICVSQHVRRCHAILL